MSAGEKARRDLTIGQHVTYTAYDGSTYGGTLVETELDDAVVLFDGQTARIAVTWSGLSGDPDRDREGRA